MQILDWLSWSNPVSFWWIFLTSVSFLNICFWFWTWKYLDSNKTSAGDRAQGTQSDRPYCHRRSRYGGSHGGNKISTRDCARWCNRRVAVINIQKIINNPKLGATHVKPPRSSVWIVKGAIAKVIVRKQIFQLQFQFFCKDFFTKGFYLFILVRHHLGHAEGDHGRNSSSRNNLN